MGKRDEKVNPQHYFTRARKRARTFHQHQQIKFR